MDYSGVPMTETESNSPPDQRNEGTGAAADSPVEPSVSETSLEEQLASARQEAAANHERYLRTVADLDNFRKRTIRDKDELRQFAASRVMEDLLPVLDNLALGLNAAKGPTADLSSIVGGITMVETQLKSALAAHGMKEINPAGEAFDPNLHEALSQAASATVPEGVVLQVIRAGYSLNNRLLRPAAVIVSSGPAKETQS